MLNRRIMGALALVVVASSALFACGGSTYSESDYKGELTKAGLSDSAADCVIAKLKDEGVKLEKNPTGDDAAALTSATADCLLSESGLGDLEDLETTTTEES